MRKNIFLRSIAILILVQFYCFTTFTQPLPTLDAAKLQLALKKLTVLGNVLYIAAHPDDENTAVLAYCANEKLLRTAYLSLTRGDGGQNLIGSEQAELMGVIRTQELLAARRIDGAEQFFTRAIDFGYSKNSEETFSIWDKDKILSDVVWVIRKFRPDVIITRFPKTGQGGHGHHTASAILAEEAFRAAADSKKFPEQLKYVTPWQAKRILWNAWLPIIEQQKKNVTKLLKLDVGEYNPLLGKSYTEIAAESRSLHKSQGFGSSGQRGETVNYFEHIAGDSAKMNLFDDIDMSWSRIQGGAEIEKILKDALKNFDPQIPSKILPQLIQAYTRMDKLTDDYWVPIKINELKNVIRSCAGIWAEAIATDFSASQGDSVKVTASIVNRSHASMKLIRVRFPFVSSDSLKNVELKKGVFSSVQSSFVLPKNINITQPYWLSESHEKGTFTVKEQTLIGMPDNPSPLVVEFTVELEEQQIQFTMPVLYRWTDPVKGELYRPFEITSPVAINLHDKVFLFPENDARKIQLTLRSNTNNASGMVRLKLHPDWKVEPGKISFSLEKKGDESEVTFNVHPPSAATVDMMNAVVEMNNQIISKGKITIDYPHIQMQTLFPSAQAKLVRLEIKRNVNNVGYIMGSGDEIANYLAQLGIKVTQLSYDELTNGELTIYDAIILGVRAYNTRERLKLQQKRLMEYVQNGGTMVVQYNTNRGFANRPTVVDNIGPYPFKISNDRVTVEDAPVKFLNPNHPLLNTPNKITEDDFKDWIQERGLYFASEWDQKYETVLSCSDPGESEKKGGLLYTKYGKGIFIYSGYAFFRQIPAGVPGAYRLFMNLISAK